MNKETPLSHHLIFRDFLKAFDAVHSPGSDSLSFSNTVLSSQQTVELLLNLVLLSAFVSNKVQGLYQGPLKGEDWIYC